MYRKCLACKGTGLMWSTPPLIEQGGLQSSNPASYPQNDDEVKGGDLEVRCWKCLGNKMVLDREP